MVELIRRQGVPALALAACVLLVTSALGQLAPSDAVPPKASSADSVPYVTTPYPDIAALKSAANNPANTDDLKAIQARVETIARFALPAIVNIQVSDGQGSGVIVSKDGYVLTAGHVSGTPNQKIQFILSNGRRVNGVTLGADNQFDSGMAKITEPGTYPYMPLGSTTKMAVGQWVMAMGHPGGYQVGRAPVLRLGKVLEVHKTDSDWFVQTDCPLIMGDSGGPVFDLNGEVVGINSKIGRSNISNIHVPIDTFTQTWERLAKGDEWGRPSPLFTRLTQKQDPPPVARATLGATAREESDGLEILSVRPNMALENGGVVAEDILTKIDGKVVRTLADLSDLLSQHKPGDQVVLDLLRKNQPIHVPVKLDASTDTPRSEPVSMRSAVSIKERFTSVSAAAGKSTVMIRAWDSATPHQAALGTVVSDDGYILTKASEIVGYSKLTVISSPGKEVAAKLVGYKEDLDLAMLKIDATGMIPVTFSDTRPAAGRRGAFGGGGGGGGRGGGRGQIPTVMTPIEPPAGAVRIDVGEWLASVDANASAGSALPPRAVGVISTARREVPGYNGFLGIGLADAPDQGGARITEVVSGSPAENAGLRVNDVVVAIEGKKISNGAELSTTIKLYTEGDAVRLYVTRGTDSMPLRAVLGDNLVKTMEDREIEILSGSVSKRAGYFSAVLQHDTVLKAYEMGGPIVDLEGHVLGINIARAGRTETFALPADVLKDAIPRLKSGDLAPLPTIPLPAPAAAE
ncbi:MAG TPA: trypsin-like peptidase domain-containing protein [Phycisphaerae bacterium]